METYGSEMNNVPPAFGFCFIGICVLISLVVLVVSIMIYAKILSKAGYSWAMSLLLLVPLGNLVLLLILAFGNWPILSELQALRHAKMAPPPEGQPHENFRGL